MPVSYALKRSDPQVITIPLPQPPYAIVDLHLVMPSQAVDFAHVGEFAWCAVGLGGIPSQLALEIGGFHHLFGQFADGQFLARANVDVAIAYLRFRWIVGVGEIDVEQDVGTGVRHVLTPKELAQG